MKSILKKIILLTISLLNVGCFLSAEILVDDIDLDNLELRTLYVGTLSVTASAGHPQITNEFETRNLTFSPDNQYIATAKLLSPGPHRLVVQKATTLTIQAQTSLPLPSTDDPTFHSLSWSVTSTSGSSYIACPMRSSTSTNQVYIYKFNGNSLQALPKSTISTSGLSASQIVQVQWSPNGQYLAVCTALSFRIYQFDGSTNFLVVSLVYGSAISGVSWSYDGKYVGFVDANANAQIYSFDGTSLTAFASAPYIDTPTAGDNYLYFHPTSNIFAVSRYLNTGYLAVRLYSYTTSGVLVLLQTISLSTENPAFGGTCVAWSPDGAYFAAGAYHIYFYSFNGTTATNIGAATINWSVDELSPISWSPDGRYIALGSRNVATTPPTINGISNSSVQIFNTGLNPTPSLTESTAKAPSTLTNLVTSTASQYWAISNGDLKFSSTESVIARMRGRWELATSQGSLTNSDHAYLLNNTVDGNFYAIDRTGKVHQSTSVIVGPKVRINWKVLSFTSGISPIFSYLIQGRYGLLGIDINKIVYVYSTSSGWLNVGISPL